MGWKDWSYWLKGAVIGLIIAIIWAIYLTIFNFQALITCSTGWGVWQNPLPNYCYVLFPINGTMSGNSGILNLLLFPVCGALIGWIVGKIKSKK